MPPKAKYTREDVIAAACEIVRERGLGAVTARELAAFLSSSARPIFTLFENMDEVISETLKSVRALYNGYVKQGLAESPAFRGVGKAYIRFAAEEPEFFRLLFMERHSEGIADVLPAIDENYSTIMQSIISEYAVTSDAAKTLYRHLWIYSHGIATLVATSSCSFSPSEIEELLTDVFRSLLQSVTGGVQ